MARGLAACSIDADFVVVHDAADAVPAEAAIGGTPAVGSKPAPGVRPARPTGKRSTRGR